MSAKYAGRPREQMLDAHDAARYMVGRAGGLRRFLRVEAYRASARLYVRVRQALRIQMVRLRTK